jgi:WD40 repeat protein
MQVRRAFAAVLCLGLAGALAAGCGGAAKRSVVVAELTAEPAHPEVRSVTVTLSGSAGSLASQSFEVASGLSSSPVRLGLYIAKSASGDNLTVLAEADGSGCKLRGEGKVSVPGGHDGEVFEAKITLRASCGGTDGGGDGASPGTDGPGSDGPGGTGADAGAGGDGPRPLDGPATTADAPRDAASPDLMVDAPVILPPPSLASCREVEHAGPKAMCDPAVSTVGDYSVYSVTFSPDSTLAATAAGDGRVKFWKVTPKSFDPSPDYPAITNSSQGRVEFSPDGKQLAVGAFEGQLFIYDLATKTKTFLDGHTDRVRGATYSSDGTRLVSMDSKGVVKLWDLAARKPLATLTLYSGVTQPWSLAITRRNSGAIWAAVAFEKLSDSVAPDGGMGLPGDAAYVWFGNLANPSQFSLLKADPDKVGAVVISPDDKTLLAGGDNAEIGVWDITNPASPKRLSTVPAVKDRNNGNIIDTNALAYSADGKYVAASYGDLGVGGVLHLYDTTSWRSIAELYMKNTYFPVSVALRPAGGMFLAGEFACGLVLVCND